MSLIDRIKHSFTASAPIEFLVKESKLISFPGFRNIPLYDVIQFFFGQVKTVGMSERSASIAFNFVMAIPPAIIFLFTLIPYLPIPTQFENELYDLIRDVIPGTKQNQVTTIRFLDY